MTDLLDVRVLTEDGRPLGWTVDVRLVLDGPLDGALARPRLYGLVVSPRTRTSFLGFERSGVTSPWPVARIVRRLHRGAFLVLWEDVTALPERRDDRERHDAHVGGGVVLRSGFVRYDPRL